MANLAKQSESLEPIVQLVQGNFLFRHLDINELSVYLSPEQLVQEKLYSSRPIYTAFRPNQSLDYLYAVVSGGPVITRSTPLDRIITMTYPGGCFGMRNLPFGFGQISRAFPSLVEAYKTTDVIKIPSDAVEKLCANQAIFRQRWGLLFELREKFHYHLLNCSTYPPQAVATLLRALIYQERSLGMQPLADETFIFDLPIDIITHACQLNHRTVEQVLKGMKQVGLLKADKATEVGDLIHVVNPEGLKEVYGATRDKVSWWPLR
ncbi:MAG: Crp/Fnr family transcriptional regulator [Cyanobacteria bacterium P01_A01_bin.123]